MTILRRVSPGDGRFILTIRAAPQLPLQPDLHLSRTFNVVGRGWPCQARRGFQHHGRVVWQTGGPSLFADVTASYYPLDSTVLTLGIVNNFFGLDQDTQTAEAWLRVLTGAAYFGAAAALEKGPPLCGGTLLFESGAYHPVDSNQLAYYRLGRVIAYTALADHRTLTDDEIYWTLRGV
jgi:hypothetical protein